MKQKLSNAREIFLQRRYGVSLGRRYVLAAAGVVLMSVLGCSQVNGSTKNQEEARPNTFEYPVVKKNSNSENKITTANTKFGLKLFSTILQNSPNENVFISPSSVAIALAMTYNGAIGSTKQAMAKALELEGLTLPEINTENAKLKQLLENPDPQVKLAIANSLWVNQNAQLNPEFLQRNQQFYQAKVSNLDFSNPGAIDTINQWVNNNTNGKIEKIVNQIQPNQILFLINAIYFKGQWTKQFDPQQTSPYPFKLSSGQEKKVQMMSQTSEFPYYENDKFQAINLPYGKEGKIGFYVFLPKKATNLNTFYQELSPQNWEKWMSQFRNREGSIRLPKFKMDYEIELQKALTALGMGEAFTDKADFSGMGEKLALSNVKHKTFVEVNEEGTEAAAATSVGVVATSITIKPEPFEMIVDRPFFCVIRDQQTGNILFMGSITNPQ